MLAFAHPHPGDSGERSFNFVSPSADSPRKTPTYLSALRWHRPCPWPCLTVMGAPHSLTATGALSFRERRRSPRVAVGREVQAGLVTIGEAVKVVELGFGGFSAVVNTPIPIGSQHEFRFRVPSGFAVTLMTTVRYCLRINSRGMTKFLIGVEFDRQDRPEVRRTIDRLLDQATSALSFV